MRKDLIYTLDEIPPPHYEIYIGGLSIPGLPEYIDSTTIINEEDFDNLPCDIFELFDDMIQLYERDISLDDFLEGELEEYDDGKVKYISEKYTRDQIEKIREEIIFPSNHYGNIYVFEDYNIKYYDSNGVGYIVTKKK